MIALHSVAARRTMSNDCTVKIKYGVVRGQKKVSSAFSKKEYYSFLGIPYGKAPLRELRFKDPQPAEPWQGIKDCLEDPPICPQKHVLSGSFVGDEDCLKVNVFTPKLPNESSLLKAVMVFIHGGAFTFGSGNTDFYGPDYLIEHDIVLVNVNYRVGALGFLTFENQDIPGNAGLKDQTLALRWVQENISAFGGDPKKVTLFGESAGGASAHYHMISPLSRGLYQNVILQSGSVLNPWALSTTGKERSFALAELLGYKTDDPLEAAKFLRKVSAEELIKIQNRVLSMKEKATVSFPFVPVVEVPQTGVNFLTKHPKLALEEGDFAHVPVILGLTSREGILVLNDILHTPEYLKVLNKHFDTIISPNMDLPEANYEDIIKTIQDFYLGGKELNWENIVPYLDFVSDVLFSIGIDQSLRYYLEKTNLPVYLYEMTFEGSRSGIKLLLNMKYPGHQIPGASHADDLAYLFKANIPELEQFVKPIPEDEIVTSWFTKMWTEFAKSGNPNMPGLGTKWEPCTKDKICYLEINEKLQMRQNRVFEDRMKFWDSILSFPIKQKL
uniref:Carboxylic ester hydrolase n=1 Tax=Clastoptera arizonana TaxID=38151 RepID=A0A1B6CB04_9HEMI